MAKKSSQRLVRRETDKRWHRAGAVSNLAFLPGVSADGQEAAARSKVAGKSAPPPLPAVQSDGQRLMRPDGPARRRRWPFAGVVGSPSMRTHGVMALTFAVAACTIGVVVLVFVATYLSKSGYYRPSRRRCYP